MKSPKTVSEPNLHVSGFDKNILITSLSVFEKQLNQELTWHNHGWRKLTPEARQSKLNILSEMKKLVNKVGNAF